MDRGEGSKAVCGRNGKITICSIGKQESGTFILDFVNEPQDVLESFLPYYRTAALADVSDPNQVHALFDKLASAGIYQCSEGEQFAQAFFNKKKSEQDLMLNDAKVRENSHVMAQVRNNTPEQAMLGDFPKAVEEAVLASGDAHRELMTRFLANKTVRNGFARLLLEMLAKPA